MPLNYEYKPYYILSNLLDLEGVKCRAHVVQCYRSCRLKYRIGASQYDVFAAFRITCYLDNAILSFKPIATFSHSRNQMCLKCISLQGFTPQFKVETRHWIGMRSAENVEFRFHHIMDNVRGPSCLYNSRKVLLVESALQKAVWTL